MFESGTVPKSALKKTKKTDRIEELWIDNNIDPNDVLASEEEESALII